MATIDPRVDAYIHNAAPFARPILMHIRKSVHTGCPDVEETIKWSFPHFVYKGMLCSMASFKAHCSFGFWKGSLLEVPPNGTPMSQFGRITSPRRPPGIKGTDPSGATGRLAQRRWSEDPEAKANSSKGAAKGPRLIFRRCSNRTARRRRPSKRSVPATSANTSSGLPRRRPSRRARSALRTRLNGWQQGSRAPWRYEKKR